MGIFIPPMRPVIVKGGVALSNNHTLLENAIGVFLLLILCAIAHTIIWYYVEIKEFEEKNDRPKLIIKCFINCFLMYTVFCIFCGVIYLITDRFF